jgi:hypothetical protein
MPVDARIALGYQPPQIESPMNRLGRFMELESAQRQNALYERQQAELMRKQQQEAAINAAYSNARTPEGRLDEGKLLNYLAEAGAGSAIPGALETVAKSREALSKASSAEFELARNNRSFYNKAMVALARRKNLTKADVISAGQMLADAGYVSRDIVDRGAASLPDDPEELRARLNEGIASELTPEQMLTVFAPKPTAIDTNGAVLMRDMNPNSPTYGKLISRDAKTMSPGEWARLLEDQRQFNATEAREAAAPPKGANLPSGYEIGPDGRMRPIPGGPADPDTVARLEAAKRPPGAPKTTEQERRDAYNAQRLLSSLRSVKSAIAKDPSAASPGALEAAALSSPFGIFEPAANIVRGNQRQIVAAAQSDAIDALLYLATGAAYNREQLEAQRQSYLVNFTDREAVRKDKRKRLEDLVEAAKVRAGNAWTPELEAELQDVLTPPGSAPKAAAAPAGGARSTSSGTRYTVEE